MRNSGRLVCLALVFFSLPGPEPGSTAARDSLRLSLLDSARRTPCPRSTHCLQWACAIRLMHYAAQLVRLAEWYPKKNLEFAAGQASERATQQGGHAALFSTFTDYLARESIGRVTST
jgi:hypothetical protein